MEDENIIKNETQILDATENYFNNLYMSADSTTQDDYNEYIKDLSLPRLSDEEGDKMEGFLTYEKCKKVLETFQNDKSPGTELKNDCACVTGDPVGQSRSRLPSRRDIWRENIDLNNTFRMKDSRVS